jgi:hypothetical protein
MDVMRRNVTGLLKEAMARTEVPERNTVKDGIVVMARIDDPQEVGLDCSELIQQRHCLTELLIL